MKFKYEAFDKFARPLHDTIEADSIELAGEVLRSQGLQVMRIVPEGEPLKTVLPDSKPTMSAGIMPAQTAVPAWQKDLDDSDRIINELLEWVKTFSDDDTTDLKLHLQKVAFERAFRIAKGEKL